MRIQPPLKLISLSIGLFSLGALLGASPATLTIEVAHPAGRVSPRLYGLMTEEINFSYDGGLYAELVRNRAFLDQPDTPVHWSAVHDVSSACSIALDRAEPLNPELPTSLRLDVVTASTGHPAGFANSGYWGIPVRPHTRYRASFYARTDGDFSTGVTLAIQSADGASVFAQATIGEVGGRWHRYEATLTTGDLAPTAEARFVLLVSRPGTAWFGLVSLFPPTWNDRPNGLRRDLMQMLVDLKPKFLRFPGGNYVEGNTIAERFNWRKTVGPLSQRPGHRSPWGYRSTDGLGLLEFLEWCEDMGAEPVLAVYAGYSLGGQRVHAGPDLASYVQEALDEIQYVAGSAGTRWGSQRAKDGHPAPFPLRYVEIGNEDNFDKANTYDARFSQIFDAIKAAYPSLKCISTIVGTAPAHQRVISRRPDVLDEHYYASAASFFDMASAKYEKYDRRGPEIFVGEWASYETSFPPWDKRSAKEPPTPNLKAAVADAAFMTEMERNSDVVTMHAYAPLLVNINPGGRQWRPDLIGYDALRAFGSPSYYAYRLFSTQVGDQILPLSRAGSGVFASATLASATGEIFLKLVNPRPTAVTDLIAVHGGGRLDPTVTVRYLTAPAAEATNSFGSPAAVAPFVSVLHDVKTQFRFEVPANGIAVLTLTCR